MILYLTSSPCIDGAPRAILNPANGFLDRLRADLPNPCRCLFLASDPDDPRKQRIMAPICFRPLRKPFCCFPASRY